MDVRFQKWGGAPHWFMRMERLGEDEHGLWLGGTPDAPFARGDNEPQPFRRGNHVVLLPEGQWWALSMATHWREIELYADIATPAEWDGDGVTVVDLDLDVARTRDGTIRLLDEDEFESHRIALSYPPEVVTRARASAHSVHRLMTARTEPFGEVAASWLGRLLART